MDSCNICGSILSTKHNLLQHINLVQFGLGKNELFKCEQCKYKGNKVNLQQHMRTTHRAEKLKCNICNKTVANSKSNLNRHIKIKHRNPELPCSICGKFFGRKDAVNNHMKTHKKIKEEKIEIKVKLNRTCGICQKQFFGPHSLKRHRKKVHKMTIKTHPIIEPIIGQIIERIFYKKPKVFSCEPCEKTFSVKSNLNRHLKDPNHGMKQKWKEKPQCPDCFKMFSTQSNFNGHRKNNVCSRRKERKILHCEICDMDFKRRGSLKSHKKRKIHIDNLEMLTNNAITSIPLIKNESNFELNKTDDGGNKSGLKSKLCPFCKTSFETTNVTTINEYYIHVEKHKLDVFKCECQETWENNKQKERHMKVKHMGYSQCPMCPKFLRDSECLSSHIDQKHRSGETEYLCPACGKSFAKEDSLKIHTRYMHVKNELIVCDECGKSVEGRARLSWHKRSKHRPKFCSICDKNIFKSLTTHMKTIHVAEEDKKYACDVCSKKFATRKHLENHKMNVHIKARPFNCRYGCIFAYNDLSNRNQHEKKKHGGLYQK